MINNRQNGRNNRRGRNNNQRPMGGGGQGPRPDAGNRIDSRQRGNAHQLHEKYKNLARDSQTQGDRVTAEYYLQFADHYFRVLNEHRARQEEHRERQRQFEPRYEDSEEDADGVMEEDPTAPIALNGLPPAIGNAPVQGNYADEQGADDNVVEEPREMRRGRGRGNGVAVNGSVAGREAAEVQESPAETEARPLRRRGRRPAAADAAQPELPVEPVAATEESAPAPRRRGRPRRQAEGVAADADA